MKETDGLGALRSMTRIVSVGKMAETRPGQVSSFWFENTESVNKVFTSNEQSVSKIKPAPTNTLIFAGMAVLLERGLYAGDQ